MTTFTTQDRQNAQRTPLTKENIYLIWQMLETNSDWYTDTEDFGLEFARAIERAHGIGG